MDPHISLCKSILNNTATHPNIKGINTNMSESISSIIKILAKHNCVTLEVLSKHSIYKYECQYRHINTKSWKNIKHRIDNNYSPCSDCDMSVDNNTNEFVTICDAKSIMARYYELNKFKPCYKISNKGEIININTSTYITYDRNRTYPRTSLLTTDNKRKKIYMHILIACVFCPDPIDIKPDDAQVDHIDRDTNNNYYLNLHWVDRLQQAKNKSRNGREEKEGFIWMDKSSTQLFFTEDDINLFNKNKDELVTFRFINYHERLEIENKLELPGEEWKSVIINNIDYNVSSWGRIETRINKYKTFGTVEGNYMAFNSYRVHRMIAKAFHFNELNYLMLKTNKEEHELIPNHKNNCGHDNRACNLEWVTQQDNANAAIDTGAKSTRKIYKYALNGSFVKEYSSVNAAVADLTLTKSIKKHISCIRACAQKNTKTNESAVSCNFIWHYNYLGPTIIPSTVYHPILKYDISGNFINEFQSIALASQSINDHSNSSIRAIRSCLNKNEQLPGIGQSYGYIWRYKHDDTYDIKINVDKKDKNNDIKDNTSDDDDDVLIIKCTNTYTSKNNESDNINDEKNVIKLDNNNDKKKIINETDNTLLINNDNTDSITIKEVMNDMIGYIVYSSVMSSIYLLNKTVCDTEKHCSKNTINIHTNEHKEHNNLLQYVNNGVIKISKKDFTEIKKDPSAINKLMDILASFDKPILPVITDISKHYDNILRNNTMVDEIDDKLQVISNTKGEGLLNYFMRDIMLKGKRNNSLTYDEAWNNLTIRKLLVERSIKYDKNFNNGALFGAFACKYGRPYNFPPNVAMALYNHFSAKRVLDPCAGYGGRLLGFWTSSATEYIGIDPNKDIPYDKLLEFLNSYNKKSARIITACAEDIDYASIGMFDCIFTSPPYFNTEIYSMDKMQSCHRYPQFNKWLHSFLFVMLAKTTQVLLPDGYLLINIKNTKSHDIISPMLRYISEELKLKECEHIKLVQPKRHKNNKYEFIYVFKKLK